MPPFPCASSKLKDVKITDGGYVAHSGERHRRVTFSLDTHRRLDRDKAPSDKAVVLLYRSMQCIISHCELLLMVTPFPSRT